MNKTEGVEHFGVNQRRRPSNLIVVAGWSTVRGSQSSLKPRFVREGRQSTSDRGGRWLVNYGGAMVNESSRRTPVRKALLILRTLGDAAKPMRLSDVAETAGLLPSTALRALAELVETSWVMRIDADRYILGPAIMSLARPANFATLLGSAARQILQDLSHKLDLMSNLQLLEPGGTRVVTAFNPPRYASVVTREGALLPASAAAGGFVLVAKLNHKDRQSWIEREVIPDDRPVFMDGLRRVAAEGHCLLRGRLDPLLSAVAVATEPFHDGLRAAIVCAGIDAEVMEKLPQFITLAPLAAEELRTRILRTA